MEGPSRVQSLTQEGISQVPPQYIQPSNNLPASHPPPLQSPLSPYPLTLPCIDLFGFDSDRRGLVREAVGQACADWGAFYVTNHGVPVHLLDEIRSLALSFFDDCPLEEKLKYACGSAAASQGYGSRMLGDNGSVLDWRDYFDHHTLPLSRRDPSRWPSFPPSYRYLPF